MTDETLPPEHEPSAAGFVDSDISFDLYEHVSERSAEAPEWAASGPPKLRRVDVIVLLFLVVLSGVLHIARLSSPGGTLVPTADECVKYPPLGRQCHQLIPLDEVHYVPDARDVVRYGTESDTRIGSDDGAYVVHPPVGKFFIAAGIKLFGDRPFGWRFFGALLATLSTALMYLFALRLWRSTWWAAMAAFLLSIEGLWFVQSRVAMLDIYAGFFVLVGAWTLLQDRDRAPGARRWWLLASAIGWGLAIASKWSTAPFLAVAFGLALAWELGRRGEHRIRATVVTAGALTLIPVIVYLATFAPWFLDSHRYNPPRCAGNKGVASQWICYQKEVANFHEHLAKFESTTSKGPHGRLVHKPAHPYFGEAWSWPWIGRPVAHFYDVSGSGTTERAHEVLGLPNPAIWWLAFAEFPLLAIFVLRRRDPVAPMLFAFFVAGYAPYLFADAVQRPVFLFYATPLIPFMVLTVVHGFVRLVDRFPRANLVPIVYCAIAATTFVYFYPVLAAWPVSMSGPLGWQARMWLQHDCLIDYKIKILCWI